MFKVFYLLSAIARVNEHKIEYVFQTSPLGQKCWLRSLGGETFASFDILELGFYPPTPAVSILNTEETP